MTNNTADIVATVIATTQYLDYQLGESALAQLCASLESADSTVFCQLTLSGYNDAPM